MEDWRSRLSSEAFKVLREEGTEPPFSSLLNEEKREGVFLCAGCESPLFSSATKFDSGTGWPSFWESIDQKNVKTKEDNSLGNTRIEIMCANCDSHLGHVFEDGPNPTGLRYCVNSLSLDFKEGKND